MRQREKPLIPWIFAEEMEKLILGIVTMAGLGESCSHVRFLLWAIEAGVRMRDSMTVTQKKKHTGGVKEVKFSKIKDMKLQRRKRAQKKMKCRSESRSVSPLLTPSPSSSRSPSPMPSFEKTETVEAQFK